MKNILDIHTHTVASGHAYSTLKENIAEANRKGLLVLGTTDHAEKMPGSCNNSFFNNYRVINRFYDELMILRGVETNILNHCGKIDIVPSNYPCLDYVVASLHTPCIKSGSVEANTNTLIKVMDIEKVKVIGHPDDNRFPLDYDRLSAAAVEKNILIEVNNSSLNPEGCREGAEENLKVLLDFGRNRGLHIILNSDAHISEDVGNIELSEKLVESIGYPKELILNYDESPERLLKFLNIAI